MTPIPKPNVRMTPLPPADPTHPLTPAPAPATASAAAAAPAAAPVPAPAQPAEGSEIDLPGGREGRFVTPQATTDVVLALGSNLGDRAATLHAAVRAISRIDGFELIAVSPFVESVAVKPAGVDPDAPAYLNAVLSGRYGGDPHLLLALINRVEADHGRERAERWGDRTLDIDIITFGELQSSDETLTIPHPRAAERDFVLAPWLALDPRAVIPGHGSVAELLARIGNTVVPVSAEPAEGADR